MNRLAVIDSVVLLTVFGVLLWIQVLYLYPKLIRTKNGPSADRPTPAVVIGYDIRPKSCDDADFVNCYDAFVVFPNCEVVVGTYSTVADARIYCNAFGSINATVTIFTNADDATICNATARTAYSDIVYAVISFVMIIAAEVVVGSLVWICVFAPVSCFRTPTISSVPTPPISSVPTPPTATDASIDVGGSASAVRPPSYDSDPTVDAA